MKQVQIRVEHMHAAALLYRKARDVINLSNEDNVYEKLQDLENAVYQYEESLQWEIVQQHYESEGVSHDL
jgi:hypothetical protein